MSGQGFKASQGKAVRFMSTSVCVFRLFAPPPPAYAGLSLRSLTMINPFLKKVKWSLLNSASYSNRILLLRLLWSMEQITTRSQSWNFTSRHITLMLWPTVVMPPKDVSPWVLGTDNTQSILSTRVAIFICYLKVLPLHFSDANDMLISNILPFFQNPEKMFA